MTISYKPRGVCSTRIEVEVEDGIVRDVHFAGGCNGNSKGIAALVKGMKADEVISKLEGVRCGARSTSCPDQLAKALQQLP